MVAKQNNLGDSVVKWQDGNGRGGFRTGYIKVLIDQLPVFLGDVNVTDRANRILGHAVIDSGTVVVTQGVAAWREDLNALNTAQATQVTIGTSAVQLDPTPLANRRSVSVKSLKANSGKVYVGFTSGVLITTGYELNSQEAWDGEIGTPQVWAIADTAGQVVSFIEVGK